MVPSSHSVPGVYRRASVRRQTFRRVRTDVVGFVGVAGPRRLGEAVRIDDWNSYVDTYLRDDRGDPIEVPPGSRTAATVQAFFANGGARCWIVNVADEIEPDRRDELLNEILGLRRPREPMERVGLELLLLQDEVGIVVLPELDAEEVVEVVDPDPLPPSFAASCFVPCDRLRSNDGGDGAARTHAARLFDDDQVLFAQRYLLSRLRQSEWRWFALLAPPPGKSHAEALAWKRALTDFAGSCSNAAIYWPWLLVQPTPGEPVLLSSPVGAVAGIYARRDLGVGPHAAPANESVRGAIGVETAPTERVVGLATDGGVNVIRPFAGHGIQVWGARTLRWQSPDRSRSDGLAYVNVRRCLTAIERTVERVGQPAVFEPNLPLLRALLTQATVGYLMTVFEAGALKGQTSDQAFRVRCDAGNNPPEAVDAGQLLCEVDVAIAAPAEFIHFRVGRREGVVEIQEGA
jgi:uncharacterized protein